VIAQLRCRCLSQGAQAARAGRTPLSVPIAVGEMLFTVCVAARIDAFFTSSFNAATLAAGVSFGKKVKSACQALGGLGRNGLRCWNRPAPVTMTRSSAPTLTDGPTGLRSPGLLGDLDEAAQDRDRRASRRTSAMTKVPRTAATTLGVLISRVSPGFILALLTPRPYGRP